MSTDIFTYVQYEYGLVRTADANLCARWATKRDAVKAAKAIGWRAGDVSKVRTRLGGETWGIAGPFGFITRESYQRRIAALEAAKEQSK